MPAVDVEMPVDSSTGPKKPNCGHHLMDFANMLKAFIGSNYLAIAFAFHQSGVTLGLIGLIIIATLTAHCCQLLVQCKYHTIRRLLANVERSRSSNIQLQKDQLSADLGKSNDSLSSESSDDLSSDENEEDPDVLHKKLLQNLNFGDIGQLCMGTAGLTLVNTAVMITQFGFCVGYYIFVGNTIHSMFPLYNCSVSVANSNVLGVVHQCLEVKHLNSLNSVHVAMEDMVETRPGVLHSRRSLPLGRSENGFHSPLNDTIATTTPATINSFMTFLMSDNVSVLHTVADTTTENTTVFPKVSLATKSPTLAAVTLHKQIHASTTRSTTATMVTPSIHSTESSSPESDSTTILAGGGVTASVTQVNTTRWTLLRGKHVPDLRLLVLSPVILFVPTTLIRNLRHLGFISILANASIFIGCIEVFMFLISGFAVSDTFLWANWQDMPIFFGMVTGAFEGIGTILPIESSMEGNRHNFTAFLYGAVAVLTLVLGCFGMLGYLKFGDGIEQMINANIPTSHWLGWLVNACLCVGVLLTFPLMMYPVTGMAEVYIFGDGRICGPRTERVNTKDYQSLLPKKEKSVVLPVAEKVSDRVATWKRNALRISIVLCAGGLAILLRNYFAYISAFVGALGSTMLAYILPCLFHLKLCWPQLSLRTKVKDITIIIIGVLCGAAGVYAVLLEIFSSLKA